MAVKHTSKDVNYAIPHAAYSKCAAFSLAAVNFTGSLHNHTNINLTLMLGIEQPRFLAGVVAHLQYSGKRYKH